MLNWPTFAKCTSALDLEGAGDLLNAFVENNDARLHELSIEGRARSSVSKLAQAIKTSARELGFADVEKCARTVEERSRDADAQGLKELIEQLDSSLDAASCMIERIRLMAAYESP